MTDFFAQSVLDRFVEADALLRQAQEQILGLTAARTSAEASAAGLATAAAAVAAYAHTAKAATETTLHVQEQVARALKEAEKLSRSFDSAQILAGITALHGQVTEQQERSDTARRSFDLRLTEIERKATLIPTSVEALGRRMTKQVTTQMIDVRTEIEAVRKEVRASQSDAAEQHMRTQEQLSAISDGVLTSQVREAEASQAISGIVDVLPRSSRRKLRR